MWRLREVQDLTHSVSICISHSLVRDIYYINKVSTYLAVVVFTCQRTRIWFNLNLRIRMSKTVRNLSLDNEISYIFLKGGGDTRCSLDNKMEANLQRSLLTNVAYDDPIR